MNFIKKFLLAGFLLLAFSATGWAQTSLSGLWIDSRTGNDFWEITGTDEAFRFTAYGGSPAAPRYLSRGVAVALEAGEMRASIRDLPEYCCGQQGSLRVKVVSENKLEVDGQYRGADGAISEVSFSLSRQGSQTASLPLPSITYDGQAELVPGQTTAGWSGAWHGDGWASFFIVQQDNKLYMYWYYSKESPFFGEYELKGDLAAGTAVALVDSPGNTYYYQELKLGDKQIEVASRRLAAPLEDGRWVSWSQAPLNNFVLHKINDQIPFQETGYLKQWFSSNHPADMLRNTLEQAAQAGKLLEREK